MQNPEAEIIQNSTTNATGAPNQRQHSTDDQSSQSNSEDARNATQAHNSEDATDSPAQPPQPPQPHQSQIMMQQPGPPQPPFFQPSMPLPMLPHIPHFQLPPYLNYQPFPPLYGYQITYPGPGPNMYMENRSWSTGLFDCFSDLKNCFITTYCPCVTFGQVSEILNEGQTPWWEGALTYLFVEIATVSIGTFFCGWAHRAKMRKKHLLKGSLFMDLKVGCFCTRLALCQIYRQLDRLGYDVPLGWKANKEKQGQRAMENCRFQVVPPVLEPGMFR